LINSFGAKHGNISVAAGMGYLFRTPALPQQPNNAAGNGRVCSFIAQGFIGSFSREIVSNGSFITIRRATALKAIALQHTTNSALMNLNNGSYLGYRKTFVVKRLNWVSLFYRQVFVHKQHKY